MFGAPDPELEFRFMRERVGKLGRNAFTGGDGESVFADFAARRPERRGQPRKSRGEQKIRIGHDNGEARTHSR